MATCLIGLGSNIGNRRQTLDRAVELLKRCDAVRVVAQSRWCETAPAGGPPGQPRFLNGALLSETSLPPESLANVLFEVEGELGRLRRHRWGPRTLDLDLLLYDRLVLRTPTLVLPHPRMAWRRFVLEPAAEIAASMIHPTTGWTIARLLRHLNSAAGYVAVTGPSGVGQTVLASRLVEVLNGRRAGAARLIADPVDPACEGALLADSSGNACALAIEFLRQRAELLAADAPEWRVPQGLAISDYWVEQSLGLAATGLAAEGFAAVVQYWESVAESLVKPKLLVVLDAPSERLTEPVGPRGAPGQPRLGPETLDRIREAILRRSRRPDVGPVLCCEDRDLDGAAQEVLAAIDAMQ